MGEYLRRRWIMTRLSGRWRMVFSMSLNTYWRFIFVFLLVTAIGGCSETFLAANFVVGSTPGKQFDVELSGVAEYVELQRDQDSSRRFAVGLLEVPYQADKPRVAKKVLLVDESWNPFVPRILGFAGSRIRVQGRLHPLLDTTFAAFPDDEKNRDGYRFVLDSATSQPSLGEFALIVVRQVVPEPEQ